MEQFFLTFVGKIQKNLGFAHLEFLQLKIHLLQRKYQHLESHQELTLGKYEKI